MDKTTTGIIIGSTLLLGGVVSLRPTPDVGGATVEEKVLLLKAQIDTMQANYDGGLPYKKYKQIPYTYDAKLGVAYWVDEYETIGNDGQMITGYQMTVRKDNGSMTSFGLGPDASFRSYDWTAPLPVSATST